jgi:hypothetical protein
MKNSVAAFEYSLAATQTQSKMTQHTTLRYTFKKNENASLHMKTQCLLVIAKKCKQSECPPTDEWLSHM